MSITRINIADPSSIVRQLNQNIGGKNVNQSNSSYGSGKTLFNKNAGITNVFKPTINIGNLSGAKEPPAKLDFTNININIIINLLCGSNHKAPSSKPSPTEPAKPKPGHSPLIDQLSAKEKEIALSVDLTAKNNKGEPLYLIAKGKDGKQHLYKGNGGKYKAVTKLPKGSNKLKPKNITTDEHGVSKAGQGSKTGSPLILDTNKDGKVSARHGQGVDINGDGRADGAASGGDKMLTLGDRNGNGKIDGTEVFGNKTVNPFTNKPINARNGFEALREVALSASKATGLNIVDPNGKVDVQKLDQALKQAKKGNLGLISDNNVTKPEALGDVAYINTKGYKEQNATGNIQHRQLGSYIDTQGNQQKVNDVWFKHA